MEWFGRSYKHFPFEMFSVSHLIIMALFIFAIFSIYLFRKKLKEENWRRAEIGAAILLILLETTYHVWMLVNRSWNVSHSLPLELCSITLVLSIILLITRRKFFFEILFFTALLGSAQAIFTPTLNYGFPHIRFFHFFITHMMVVWVAFYFTWAKGYRPTIWSVIKLFVLLNLFLPVILFVNKLTNGNYLYLSHKPNSPSLFDLMGPHPWYIFSAEGFLIFLSLLVWYMFRKKGKKPHKNTYSIIKKREGNLLH